MATQTKHKLVLISDRLPPPERPVIVVCHEFRCFGRVDEQGHWLYDSNGTEIDGRVVAWADFE